MFLDQPPSLAKGCAARLRARGRDPRRLLLVARCLLPLPRATLPPALRRGADQGTVERTAARGLLHANFSAASGRSQGKRLHRSRGRLLVDGPVAAHSVVADRDRRRPDCLHRRQGSSRSVAEPQRPLATVVNGGLRDFTYGRGSLALSAAGSHFFLDFIPPARHSACAVPRCLHPSSHLTRRSWCPHAFKGRVISARTPIASVVFRRRTSSFRHQTDAKTQVKRAA